MSRMTSDCCGDVKPHAPPAISTRLTTWTTSAGDHSSKLLLHSFKDSTIPRSITWTLRPNMQATVSDRVNELKELALRLHYTAFVSC
eukprot:g41776.t1